jgi:hypothetical protein
MFYYSAVRRSSAYFKHKAKPAAHNGLRQAYIDKQSIRNLKYNQSAAGGQRMPGLSVFLGKNQK